MSSPKNSITSHSSYLWSEAIVCFCLLSNPFRAASGPRLQTKGSVAPARSDETKPGFETLGSPPSASLFHYEASEGNEKTRATNAHLIAAGDSPSAARVRGAGGPRGHPRASPRARAGSPWPGRPASPASRRSPAVETASAAKASPRRRERPRD